MVSNMLVELSDKHRQFIDQLANVHESMEALSIEHRVIGSVAVASYGIFSLDFNRNSSDPVEQIPDIDMVVPRDQLDGAREVRQRLLTTDFPVKVGLAIPSLQIDMHPDKSESRLTSGRASVAIHSDAFKQTDTEYGGAPVRTVPIETLRHIYGSLSPRRSKDAAKLDAFTAALGTDGPHDKDDFYNTFYEYENLATDHQSLSRRSMNVYDRLARHISPEVERRTRRMGMYAVGRIGWR